MRLPVLLAILLVAACGGGDTGTTPPPPAVTAVDVTLSQSTVTVGGTVQATAVPRGSAGPVAGRTITWNSSAPAVATVSTSGLITTLGAGTTTISASTDGVTGTALLTVAAPPVATVQVFGTQRVKVGDPYQLLVEARLADGSLVQRPITYAISTPGSLTISPTGVLTAQTTGTLGFRVSVEGVSAQVSVTAYDWTLATAPGIIAVSLPADLQISNKFGTSEYPDLVIGCVDGTFLLYVGTENFVTASGLVGYAFDGGASIISSWIESNDFSSLIHPGPTNLATKNFAASIALASRFDFAFNEFQSVARATRFRVSGLTPLLNQLFAACPSNAVRESLDGLVLPQLSAAETSDEVRALRTLRAGVPATSEVPMLSLPAVTDQRQRLTAP